MTGGLGFTRHSQDTFKANHKLLNSRTLMKDNLFSSSKDFSFRESQINFAELKQYHLDSDKKRRKTRRIVYSIILIFTLLVVGIIMLLNQ